MRFRNIFGVGSPAPSSEQKAESRLVPEANLDAVKRWFAQFGNTAESYLAAHFDRFQKTKAFAIGSGRRDSLSILDVGAHWLHNAFLYANEGHVLRCVDAPNTMRYAPVVAAAKVMGASLHPAAHLEFGDGINEIAESSIDLVLFCEIIEHLAFNPIPLWQSIYRVMKPGGRIIITTPNANYWPQLNGNINRLIKKGGWGPTVHDIFVSGTFGHHWKEFTADELATYFSTLSIDFEVSKRVFYDIQEPTAPPSELPFEKTEDVLHDSIFMEITLKEKRSGIAISPPWLPQYA